MFAALLFRLRQALAYTTSDPVAIRPADKKNLPALWCFLSSPEYTIEARKLDRQLKLTTGTLLQVPFDLELWKRIAVERYPDGLPSPFSRTYLKIKLVSDMLYNWEHVTSER
jgi:hypothetical protein